MTFYLEMRQLVLDHGAINNSYLDRFRSGDLSDKELQAFGVEFYNFVRFFPQILVAQLVNTEDEQVADELTKVLYSELGGGEARHRHELLYRDFLRSIGIQIHDAMAHPMLPSTHAYIEGMEQLYGDRSHAKALGASFALENMAITMWDHLIPGLMHLKATRHPQMDLTYFTFHRQLEESHEDAMKRAVQAMDGLNLAVKQQEDFRLGMIAVLDYLEGFWRGLEHRRFTNVGQEVLNKAQAGRLTASAADS
ncbi:MAG: iron-containing redox enzyme family protein [Nitrospira sp.]|nr:iron-containing redox enzyme family protein [Nitrospira sp.]